MSPPPGMSAHRSAMRLSARTGLTACCARMMPRAEAGHHSEILADAPLKRCVPGSDLCEATTVTQLPTRNGSDTPSIPARAGAEARPT